MHRQKMLALAVVTATLLLGCSRGTDPQPASPKVTPSLSETSNATTSTVPVVPDGAPAVLIRNVEGYQLVMAKGAFIEWEREISPKIWEVFFQDGSGSWAVDVERGELSRWPLVSLKEALTQPILLPDGRILGLRGNDRSTSGLQVSIVIQDSTSVVEQVAGTIDKGVQHLAPAGTTSLAYSLYDPKPGGPGALWQYDWTTKQHTMVTQRGWPVGIMADGSAVAHRDSRAGELITWHTGRPDELRTISNKTTTPYRATIAPDGRFLFYFLISKHAVDLPGNPLVDAIAVYDSETKLTKTVEIPVVGRIVNISWDPDQNIVVQLQDAATQKVCFLKITPEPVVSTLFTSPETFTFAGWDADKLILRRADGAIYEIDAKGNALRLDGPLITGHGMMALPEGRGLKVFDLKTGKHYIAPEFSIPTHTPAHYSLGAIRPNSGYVAVLTQIEPQQVYRLIKVLSVGQ